MRDYRIDGPPEARTIASLHAPCVTAPNGTGSRCACNFDCANYWLRAKGFKAEGAPADSIPVVVAAPRRKRWWQR